MRPAQKPAKQFKVYVKKSSPYFFYSERKPMRTNGVGIGWSHDVDHLSNLANLLPRDIGYFSYHKNFEIKYLHKACKVVRFNRKS